MPPAAITAEMPDLPPCSSSMASRFPHLRGVQWRINLGNLPNSLSSTIEELRRASADNRRRYAALRRRLLVDPQVTKLRDDSSNLVLDNPLSQNPDSTWSRFFRNVELEQMVNKDLSRLYPEHCSYFHTPGCQGLLRRILLLWCLRHPEWGYRQGMHELLAPLLYVLHADIQHFKEVSKLYEEHFVDKFDEGLMHENLDFNFNISANTVDYNTGPREQSRKHTSLSDLDINVHSIVLMSDPYGAEGELGIVLSEKFLEHDAYCMFDALMSGAGGAVAMAEFFSHLPASAAQPGFPPVIEASLALYHLLSVVDSSLYAHLVELGVEPQYFALRWLRVLFGREFSLEDLLVIWDAIFSFDNSQHVMAPANDPGVFNTPRGTFISAMAVSMMLNVRSSLLATDYATSCLQKLLNFPENVNLEKLIGKAKSLMPVALAASVPSYSAPPIGHGYQSKETTVKGHAHSLSFDSSAQGNPVSIVPERYWEEKWRVAQEEEETKKEIDAKLESPRKKGWTEKIKLRLFRTESDLPPSKRETKYGDKRSVRRSLFENLFRLLKFEKDSEGTGHDGKLSCLLAPLRVESDTDIDKTCSSISTASEEHSPAFSESSSRAENDSERSSCASNLSHDTIDTDYQDAGNEIATYIDKTYSGISTASEEHSPAFPELSSGAEYDSVKSNIASNLSHDTIDTVYLDTGNEIATYIDKTCSGISTASEEPSPAFSESSSLSENDSEKRSIASNLSHNTIDGRIHDSASFQLVAEESHSAAEESYSASEECYSAAEESHSAAEESPRSISDASDDNGSGACVSDNSSKELSATVSKDRKSLSGKFQWFSMFRRQIFGEGTSDKRQEVEDVKSADRGTRQGNNSESSVDETNCDRVNIKSDGCDQNLLCTLRTLGQSMLENIQVIESTFQQEKGPPDSLDQLSKHALLEKGQVTAITALKELRKISHFLQEM